MKKKTLFATVGAGLSLALAAVALGGFLGNQGAAEVGATAVTASMTSFSATSGAIGTDTVATYEAKQGGAATAPAINTNVIRLYQGTTTSVGGYVTVSVKAGYKITAFSTTTAMATTLGYSADATTWIGKTSVAADGTYSQSVLSGSSFSIGCFGTSKTARYYCSSLSVTYDVSTDPSISISNIPSSPVDTGATGTLTAVTANVTSPTITWSSDNACVTINSSTGAYSAVSYGEANITASMVVSGTTYTATGTISVNGTATIAQALAVSTAEGSGKTTAYKLTIPGTISAVGTSDVTITDGTNSIKVYGLYNTAAPATKGYIAGGVVSVTGKIQNYNRTAEVTSPVVNSYTIDVDSLVTYIMAADTADQCTTKYAIAKINVLLLSASDLSTFKTSTATNYVNARARYEAWAINQGDAAPYASAAAFIDNMTSGTAVIAITVVSVLGLLTLAGVMVIRKKHN